MEIEGMIIQSLDMESGVGRASGKNWQKKGWVMEIPNGQYPRKVKFDVWGDRAEQFAFEMGKNYVISVDVESREFNGRWYTDIKCFAMRPSDGQPQTGAYAQGGSQSQTAGVGAGLPPLQPQMGADPFAGSADDSDDLPF